MTKPRDLWWDAVLIGDGKVELRLRDRHYHVLERITLYVGYGAYP